STNQFFAASIGQGLAGKPTRFLISFDPVASPPQLVERMRDLTPSETLDRYCDSVDALDKALAACDAPSRATVIAESPLGHVSIDAVVLHALWDAWIHERDILLARGETPTEDRDEVEACLLYAAAVGPALLAASGSTRAGRLRVSASGPDVAFD